MNIKNLINRIVLGERLCIIGVKKGTSWEDLLSGKVKIQSVYRFNKDYVPLNIDMTGYILKQGESGNNSNTKGGKND
jgi:hypothetical protein